MKITASLPLDQVYWYIQPSHTKRLTKDTSTDVVIVGGGMAGLSAAQSFRERGYKVVLVEKNYCGSGATGKSSGFVTPDCEIPLNILLDRYGPDKAKLLWDFVIAGGEQIRSNIKTFSLACDYAPQDTLVVATTAAAFSRDLTADFSARKQLKFPSTLLEKNNIPCYLGTHEYYGGITYPHTFGIRAYAYCQEMKRILIDKGVKVYEETPALTIAEHTVHTPLATIRAEHIIVCADHAMNSMPTLAENLYHAQTFLMISAPLTAKQKKLIFPHKPYMVWDTETVYHYFRITGDGRLLLGGSNLWYTFAHKESHDTERIMRSLSSYFDRMFPLVQPQWEYIWPGMIGISKDLFPLAGRDASMPSVYHITATAGLPWAAALGAYSAAHIADGVTDLDSYFSPYRSFSLGGITQKPLGTPLTFALSNFLSVRSI